MSNHQDLFEYVWKTMEEQFRLEQLPHLLVSARGDVELAKEMLEIQCEILFHKSKQD
ncbi:hypothetical protein LCGC14_0848760 [marine sediment metagenome]|uniref:HEPN domain-containing protein n=1 Tax=marine sediment metagenome TaxID=412755 RepID=A0A0F9PFQ6_9ZZZZ